MTYVDSSEAQGGPAALVREAFDKFAENPTLNRFDAAAQLIRDAVAPKAKELNLDLDARLGPAPSAESRHPASEVSQLRLEAFRTGDIAYMQQVAEIQSAALAKVQDANIDRQLSNVLGAGTAWGRMGLGAGLIPLSPKDSGRSL